MYVKKPASPVVQDLVAAMQAKYPQLKECAALVKLGLTAADKVSVMHSTGLYYHIAWTFGCTHWLRRCYLRASHSLGKRAALQIAVRSKTLQITVKF